MSEQIVDMRIRRAQASLERSSQPSDLFIARSLHEMFSVNDQFHAEHTQRGWQGGDTPQLRGMVIVGVQERKLKSHGLSFSASERVRRTQTQLMAKGVTGAPENRYLPEVLELVNDVVFDTLEGALLQTVAAFGLIRNMRTRQESVWLFFPKVYSQIGDRLTRQYGPVIREFILNDRDVTLGTVLASTYATEGCRNPAFSRVLLPD